MYSSFENMEMRINRNAWRRKKGVYRQLNRWPSCFRKGKDHLRMIPAQREISKAKRSREDS